MDAAEVAVWQRHRGHRLAVHVYDDARYERVVQQMESFAPYALTGAVIAQDRQAIAWAEERLRFAAGNFYINDKPTGAVVGQQPFGGARASGTNDKAGSWQNLIRWVSPYALTGSIFATDRTVLDGAATALRFAAGNFYLNDKPTGAVVGQQPFGGARASGTNDKAGSWQNLVRWMSPRTIKETFVPPTDHGYPHMAG